ncbi:hypothetical protein [Chitinolyticbacter meiyuanensis]|uniref:hypothetical protein n=1 Tax=Chitinolyticbacter meiyuanensis TaxID=682798 RepID=UPI0011E5FB8F|nr:hypothetical protein [Chitinolyticbacter meiyuanensis]
MISLEHDLSLALSTRLAGIRTADGFHTDIGAEVFRGRVAFDPDRVPCVVLVEKDDVPLEQKRSAVKLGLPYLLIGYACCDPAHPNDTAHQIIADIKRALFSPADPLHPKVREIQYQGRSILPREDGLSLVSAVVEIRLEVVGEL